MHSSPSLLHDLAQLDEGTLFVNGSLMNTEEDIVNWLGAQLPGLDIGITNVPLLRELLQHYPVSPAAGSPYGTGNETFGQGAQLKRFASVLGDLLFQASRMCDLRRIYLYSCLQAPRQDHLRTATRFGLNSWYNSLPFMRLFRICLE